MTKESSKHETYGTVTVVLTGMFAPMSLKDILKLKTIKHVTDLMLLTKIHERV
jgi:hypothetical protein